MDEGKQNPIRPKILGAKYVGQAHLNLLNAPETMTSGKGAEVRWVPGVRGRWNDLILAIGRVGCNQGIMHLNSPI